MDCPDPVSSLLAFHANGTLPAEERLKVESHLAGCIDCQAMLGLARLARQEIGAEGFDPSHVQAQLLSEYVDGSVVLDEQTRAWIASHLQGCDVCASVVPVLRSMPGGAHDQAGVAKASNAAAAPSRLWELLKGTVLHPVPALAYLMLVAVGLVWVARTGGPATIERGPAALLPPPVAVHGEIGLRGASAASPPQRLEAVRGSLRLALHTDLDAEETSPGAPPLRLLLRRGSDVLWSALVEPESIPADGVLEMTLEAERVPRNVPLEVVLQRDSGGERMPLFLKRFIVAGPGESPSPDGP